VGVVGAAAGAQGTAPVRRCHVSTQAVVAACLLVPLGVGGLCMCASALARASTQVLGGDAACASVTLIVTHLALLVLGAAVVVALCSAHVHVVGAASVEQDVVHVPDCRVLSLVVGAACLFVRVWVGGVSLCFVVDRSAVFLQPFRTWLSISVFVSPPTALVTWTCTTPLMNF